jgi:HK97 family phage portal protein
MGILDRLTGRRGDEHRWTLQNPPENALEMFGGHRSKAGVVVNVGTALQLIPVFACVTLLSSTVGMTPMMVYRGQGRTREEAVDSWQWDLLHEEPNDEQAPDQFFEMIEAHLNLWGDAFVEKIKGRDSAGRPIVGEIWALTPSRVQVEREERPPFRKRFHVDAESRTYGPESILHIPAFGYNGVRGMSPIAVARSALGTVIARSDFEAEFYANGAVFPGYLQKEGKLTPQQREELRAGWEAMHSGSGARHRTGVLSDGLTWQQAGMPLADMQFLEQSQFSVGEVARLFQVPPEMVGGSVEGGLRYSTVEGQWTNYIRYSVARWYTRIERAFRRDPDFFSDPKELAPKFRANALLRGDAKARGELYKVLAGLQAISVEEIRDLEDLGPAVEGDTFPTPAGAPAGEPPASSSSSSDDEEPDEEEPPADGSDQSAG